MNLFKWVEDLVEGAIKQIMDQVNMVTNAVTNPLKRIVQEVTGGVWKGDGANRFSQEMTNDVLPMLASLLSINSAFANGFKQAQAALNQAVQQATSAVNQLVDVFNGIF
jgi:hypothetical protein